MLWGSQLAKPLHLQDDGESGSSGLNLYQLAGSLSSGSTTASQEPAQRWCLRRAWVARAKAAASKRAQRASGVAVSALEKFNASHAVRRRDLLPLPTLLVKTGGGQRWLGKLSIVANNVSEGTPQCKQAKQFQTPQKMMQHDAAWVVGRGSGKRWLPSAMLRVAFGPCQRASPLASSARRAAEDGLASHGHIQRVRNAVALTWLQLQDEALKSALVDRGVSDAVGAGTQDTPAALLEYSMCELRFDETHMEFAVPGPELCPGVPGYLQVGFWPLLMLKGSLIWKEPTVAKEHVQPLVLPPAILPVSCTAEALWGAVHEQLPFTWQQLAEEAELVGILLGHDSHKANLRFVRALVANKPENCVLVNVRCCMHQLQIVLKDVYMLDLHAIHNPIYCISNLLAIGKNSRCLKEHMHKVLEERFVVRYTDPCLEHRQWASEFLRLVFHDGSQEDEDPENPTSESQRKQRMLDMEEALALFTGDWQSPAIIHHCRLGCRCSNTAHSLERAHAILARLVLPANPGIIALNKWTKFQGPTKRLCVGCGLHGILPEAWRRMMADRREDDGADEIDDGLAMPTCHDGAPGGLEEENTYKREKRARLATGDAFFQDELSLTKVLTLLLLVRPLNGFVARLFRESKDDFVNLRTHYQSPLLDYISLEHSPAMGALHKYTAFLVGGIDYWMVLGRNLSPEWTAHLRSSVLRVVGNIWERFVRYFQHWPWKLGMLADGRVSEAKQQEIADTFYDKRICCVGRAVGKPLQLVTTCGQDLLSPKKKQFLSSLFLHARSQTVPVEERFKRARTSSASNSGHAQHASTICSNHTLAEIKSSHALCRSLLCSGGQAQSTNGASKTASWKRSLCGWNIFLSKVFDSAPCVAGEARVARIARLTREAAARWKSMPAASKLDYLAEAATATRKRKRQAGRQDTPPVRMASFGPPESTTQSPHEALWGLGDDSFGLSLGLLEKAEERLRATGKNFIKAAAEQWQAKYGKLVADESMALFPELLNDAELCESIYGTGFCKEDLTDVQRDFISKNASVLNSIIATLDRASKQGAFLIAIQGLNSAGCIVSRLFKLMVYPNFAPAMQVYVPPCLICRLLEACNSSFNVI